MSCVKNEKKKREVNEKTVSVYILSVCTLHRTMLCVQPGWYSKFSRIISGLEFTLPDGETMVMLNG